MHGLPKNCGFIYLLQRLVPTGQFIRRDERCLRCESAIGIHDVIGSKMGF